MYLLKALSVYVSAHRELHAVPNLKALFHLSPTNLNYPLLHDLSATAPVYVLLFVWLRE
jgi:hypothetical protein